MSLLSNCGWYGYYFSRTHSTSHLFKIVHYCFEKETLSIFFKIMKTFSCTGYNHGGTVKPSQSGHQQAMKLWLDWLGDCIVRFHCMFVEGYWTTIALTGIGLCFESLDIRVTGSLSVDAEEFDLILFIVLKASYLKLGLSNVFFFAHFSVICNWFHPPFQSVLQVIIAPIIQWCRPCYSEVIYINFKLCVGDTWFSRYTYWRWFFNTRSYACTTLKFVPHKSAVSPKCCV